VRIGTRSAGTLGEPTGAEGQLHLYNPEIDDRVGRAEAPDCRRGPEGSRRGRDGALTTSQLVPLREARDSFESEYVRFALDRRGGNVAQAAMGLDTPRTNLYKLFAKHGITRDRRRRLCRACGQESQR
jgi:DNA-binding NtrC family response regulator